MHPLTVVTGIMLGSATAIAVGLAVVMLMFLLLSGKHPHLSAELGPLVTNTLIFSAMTAISAASFISLVKKRHWWWIPQAGMWVGLGLIVLYYLP
jgi:uncharacterized membrane protein